ncbi:MAG TPA: HD domain-containing protein [bacterium]|nr:HD domain-containing protein [bacterium]
MKTIFINELGSGVSLQAEHFVLTDFKEAVTKKGDTYYRLKLADKTGSISGIVWNNHVPDVDRGALEVGTVIALDATVESFQENLQLNIQRIAKAKDYDNADFIQKTRKDVKKLWKFLVAEIDSVENKEIKILLKSIIENKEYSKKLKTLPGGITIHHAFIGGLLEHLCEMFSLAASLYEYYPEADPDIVRAGILLHDIGKLYEIEEKGTVYDYTLEGNLIGHMTLGVEFLLNHLPKDFPEDIKTKIIHIIMSHNGEVEKGSPIPPKTIEAAIVAGVDRVSSNVRQFQKHIQNNEGSDREFSHYDKYLNAGVYLK